MRVAHAVPHLHIIVFLLANTTCNISLPSIIDIATGLINSDQYQPCCWWLINSYFRKMSSLQWPVISPANQAGAYKVPTYGNLVCKGNGISFRGIQLIDKVNMSYPSHSRKNKAVKCSLYSPSNESNSKAGDFMEGDTAYVNAFVVETAEVRGSSDGLMVLMKDGKVLRCVHNNPRSRHQPHYTQNPLILLKIEEDGTGLLLPLLVLEKKPGMQLMDDATDDVQIARPSMYEVVMEMIEKMDYAVKLVRVADRAHGSYVSQLYLTKVKDKAEIISFDLQPSDAINIAIRCKAPIQVDRHLVYSDCLKVIEFAKPAAQGFSSDDVSLFSAELDRPSDEQCVDAKEFNLLLNMLVAAVEERYSDAEIMSFELQPSDAINIAIRCKAPIQVDRHLAYSDCLKVVEFAKPVAQGFSSDDVLLFSAELDRPSDEQCVDTKEFNLLLNMLVAAVEERYSDAAQWRDKLNQHRSTLLWMFV